MADGLSRIAWGEVAELRWQLGTFGFHLASLEIRQHSTVHAAALRAIREGRPPSTELVAGVTLGEVLATFRGIAAAQARHGVDACRRYIVSFTASAGDVTDVLELARLAASGDTGPTNPPVLDVVPLFESSEALERAGGHPLRPPRPTRAIAPGSGPAEIGRKSCSATPIRTRSSGFLAASVDAPAGPGPHSPRPPARGAWS